MTFNREVLRYCDFRVSTFWYDDISLSKNFSLLIAITFMLRRFVLTMYNYFPVKTSSQKVKMCKLIALLVNRIALNTDGAAKTILVGLVLAASLGIIMVIS